MAATFKQGDRFGGYVVVARLGGGFFGETWLCENEVTGRKAVLKGLKEDFLTAQPEFLKGFDVITRSREEASILAALNTKRFSFVPVLFDAVSVADGRTFFIMEYVEGRLLADWIPATENSPKDRARLAVGVLDAVIRLHSVDIIHRDLAGDNIVVEPSPGSFKILDFGIAKIKSELLVRRYSQATTDPFSKLKYTPPKALAARVAGQPVATDESWDLYALGVLFFEMFVGSITGRPETDITPAGLQQTPCPETIRSLLEHGRSDTGISAAAIAVSLQRELRNAELGDAIAEAPATPELVASLNQEIRQMRQDLASRRGTTDHEDIARYLSRMEITFTVNPKKKRLSFRFGDRLVRGTVFVIDGGDAKLLELYTAGLRFIDTKMATETLYFLNDLNLLSSLVRVALDTRDGEVRVSLDIPHANVAVPYEEFAAQLGAFLSAAQDVGEALDKRFGAASRREPSDTGADSEESGREDLDDLEPPDTPEPEASKS